MGQKNPNVSPLSILIIIQAQRKLNRSNPKKRGVGFITVDVRTFFELFNTTLIVYLCPNCTIILALIQRYFDKLSRGRVLYIDNRCIKIL